MYPALFVDLDLAAEVKVFYRDFFGHDLTDTQVAEILSGTLNPSPVDPPLLTFAPEADVSLDSSR